MTVKQIPLEKHPAYKRLKTKLMGQGAATCRFLSFIGSENPEFHVTDQLYDKKQSDLTTTKGK